MFSILAFGTESRPQTTWITSCTLKVIYVLTRSSDLMHSTLP